MRLWNAIFGTSKPYRPGSIWLLEDHLYIEGTRINLAISKGSHVYIEGTIAKEQSIEKGDGTDAHVIQGLDGTIYLPQKEDLYVEVHGGLVEGDVWNEGSIDAKIAKIALRRKMNITAKAETVSAPEMTKMIDKYVLSHLLPKKLQKAYDVLELTEEEINEHWEALSARYDDLPEITVKAKILQASYLPIDNKE